MNVIITEILAKIDRIESLYCHCTLKIQWNWGHFHESFVKTIVWTKVSRNTAFAFYQQLGKKLHG